MVPIVIVFRYYSTTSSYLSTIFHFLHYSNELSLLFPVVLSSNAPMLLCLKPDDFIY